VPHDIRVALRSLFRARAFTTTTVLTLAFAAGANAAIFAVVYGVLVRPLPVPEADRLVAVWPQHFQSNVDLLYTREHGRIFSSVAAVAPGWTMSMSGIGDPVKLTVARVSGNLFSTIGVEPLLGRPFTEEAALPGHDGVMVLDYGFWMRRFGGDPGIGKSTLLLQATGLLAAKSVCVYVTGEESVDQVRLRAQRLGLGDAKLVDAPLDGVKGLLDRVAPDVAGGSRLHSQDEVNAAVQVQSQLDPLLRRINRPQGRHHDHDDDEHSLPDAGHGRRLSARTAR